MTVNDGLLFFEPQPQHRGQVYDFDPVTNEPIFTEPVASGSDVTRNIQRIWEELGGLSAPEVREEILKTAIEKGLADPKMIGQEEDDDDTMNTEARIPTELKGKGKEVSPEEMHALKEEVLGRLFQAHQSLSLSHHLMTLLLPPSTQNPLPPHITLPPSLFSTTLAQPLPNLPPPEQPVLIPTNLLGTKQASLRSCSASLAAASDQLRQGVESWKDEWQTARNIKKAGWAVSLASSKDNRAVQNVPGVGNKRKEAMEWSVCYALDDAPSLLRARSVAFLPPPNTTPVPSTLSTSTPKLLFPALKAHTLQVTLHETIDGVTTSTRSTPLCPISSAPESGNTAQGIISELIGAQWETISEDIFNEIAMEARSTPQLNAVLADKNIDVFVFPGLRMNITMASPASFLILPVSLGSILIYSTYLALTQASTVPISTSSSESSSLLSSASITTSPQATLALSQLILSILNLHTFKRRLTHFSLHPIASSTNPAPRPKILAPLIETLQWTAFRNSVDRLVQSVVTGMGVCGVSVELKWEEAFEGVGGGIEEIMGLKVAGVPPVDKLGALGIISIEQSKPILLNLSPPTRLHLVLSDTSSGSGTALQLPDVTRLYAFLETEIKTVLLKKIIQLGRSAVKQRSVENDLLAEGAPLDDDGSGLLCGVATVKTRQGIIRFKPNVHLSHESQTLRIEGLLIPHSSPTSKSFGHETGGDGVKEFSLEFSRPDGDTATMKSLECIRKVIVDFL